MGILRAWEAPLRVGIRRYAIDCGFYHKMVINPFQYTTKGGQLLDGFKAYVSNSQSRVDIHPPLVLPSIEQTVHLFDSAACVVRR